MFGAPGSGYYSPLAALGRAPGSRAWQDLVIAPPGAADVLTQLSFASASIDSSMGLVGAAWTDGTVPCVGDVCGRAEEKGAITLKCAGGGAFTRVAFAAYGMPTGACAAAGPAPAANASCDAPGAAAAVAALCVGKSACTISVTTEALAGGVDPCPNVTKHAIVALEGACADVLYSVAATVPVGARARVRVPTRGRGAAAATVEEGGARVWAAGAFVPGVPGVSAAAAVGDAIEFSVGSGAYDFVVM